MDKSLAPLIAVFALIILLSILLVNSETLNSRKNSGTDRNIGRHEIQIRTDSGFSLTTARNIRRKNHGGGLLDTDAVLNQARKKLADGDAAGAEALLKDVLVFAPDNRQAISLLGGIFFYSGRYREAEFMFRKLVKLEPANAVAYNHLSSALAKQKKFDEAIKNALVAAGMNPDSGPVHINLAGMYSVTGRKKEAVEEFRKAYALISYAVLPLSYDSAFDNIRQMPEFQEIISEAESQLEKSRLSAVPRASAPCKSPDIDVSEEQKK